MWAALTIVGCVVHPFITSNPLLAGEEPISSLWVSYTIDIHPYRCYNIIPVVWSAVPFENNFSRNHGLEDGLIVESDSYKKVAQIARETVPTARSHSPKI